MIGEKNVSIKKVSETDEKEIREWIKRVGFSNKKAKYIKNATDMIINQYDGKVPSDYSKVLSLPGVGPKMANLLLQISFDKVEGISVDTHMHRISNRLKWVKKTTSSPEYT
jgi:endonuclease-3